MKRNVYLTGEIGEKFGTEFVLNVDSFKDAFKCLECNFPDFRKYILDCVDNDVGFICDVAGKEAANEEDLLMMVHEGDMTISSVPAGSKSGGAKILTAIAIVALMFIPGGQVGLAAWATGGVAGGSIGFAGMMAAGLAINLALTGIQQLMAPDPATDAQVEESYLFNGAEQNIVEGDPVPVLYGELRVPGQPISFEVLNQEFHSITPYSGMFSMGSSDFYLTGL